MDGYSNPTLSFVAAKSARLLRKGWGTHVAGEDGSPLLYRISIHIYLVDFA
jgi:hypothetical protein